MKQNRRTVKCSSIKGENETMKKTKLFVGIVSVCSLFLAGEIVSLAAVVDNTNTNGEINFTPNSDPNEPGEIITPNEDDEPNEVIELPGGGSNTKGPLRIQFVPNLKFGSSTNMTAGEVKEQLVNVIPYNIKGQAPAGQKIAPFVQVTDLRGNTGDAASWELNVKASAFTADLPGGGTDVLANVKLLLPGSTVTMDYGDTAKAKTLVDGQSVGAAILTDNVSATSVLKTKKDQSTSGYQVSNVFFNNYVKDNFTQYTNDKSTGVSFYKPAGQAPIKDAKYISVLTWTLIDSI